MWVDSNVCIRFHLQVTYDHFTLFITTIIAYSIYTVIDKSTTYIHYYHIGMSFYYPDDTKNYGVLMEEEKKKKRKTTSES